MSLLSKYDSLRLYGLETQDITITSNKNNLQQLFGLKLSEVESRVCAELSVEFPFVYLVLEESKPQAAVKVQEAMKRPEVTDKTDKLEKRVTPQEETKPGIKTRIPK